MYAQNYKKLSPNILKIDENKIEKAQKKILLYVYRRENAQIEHQSKFKLEDRREASCVEASTFYKQSKLSDLAHLFKRPHMTPGNCSLMVRISKICLKFIFILVNFEKSTKKNIRQFLILCNNNRRENAHMIEQQLKVFTAEAP